jgi:hypothetical protein
MAITTYSDNCLALFTTFGQLCSITEIGNLHRAIGAKKNIITLDVTMHTMHSMDILETSKCLHVSEQERERERERESE